MDNFEQGSGHPAQRHLLQGTQAGCTLRDDCRMYPHQYKRPGHRLCHTIMVVIPRSFRGTHQRGGVSHHPQPHARHKDHPAAPSQPPSPNDIASGPAHPTSTPALAYIPACTNCSSNTLQMPAWVHTPHATTHSQAKRLDMANLPLQPSYHGGCTMKFGACKTRIARVGYCGHVCALGFDAVNCLMQ